MAAWSEFREAAPEFAGRVQARFAASRHAILGTLRRDGAPRLTGLEVPIRDGELWLAMMPGSRKADDLVRDPRFSLHSGPDVEMADGDATLGGRAALVEDAATIDRFGAGLEMQPPGGLVLFRADLTHASLVRVEGDDLVVTSWRPGEPVRETRRQ